MNEKIKILFVTKSTGGVAEYVHQLVRGMDKSQFDITVACLSENGPEFAALLSAYPDIKTFSLAMNRYDVDLISDLQVLFALSRHLKNEKYNIIHAHASKPGFITRMAAWGTGVPVLYSPHCFAFHDGAGFLKSRLTAFLEFLAAKFLTEKIVFVADGEKDLALRYSVGKVESMVTIYTGIDTERFSTVLDTDLVRLSLGVSVDVFLVGAVGRMSKQKAPLDFVRMAKILNRNNPSIHFIWIGNGPLLSDVENMVKELSLSEVFHMPGHRSDVPEILRTLDCFVLASKWEGFPIVLLEAMAAGAPIISTNIAGSNEAVRNNIDGWLVPAGDLEAMAEAVKDLINSPEKKVEFCNNARKRVEQNFQTQLMLDKLQNLYKTTVNKHEELTLSSSIPEKLK